MMPALYLWRSAEALKANQIEDSLENQYKFWRFTGVAVICALLSSCLVIPALTLLGGTLSAKFVDVATAVSTAS
jgi:Flp pilus assembly pilin Flp